MAADCYSSAHDLSNEVRAGICNKVGPDSNMILALTAAFLASLAASFPSSLSDLMN